MNSGPSQPPQDNSSQRRPYQPPQQPPPSKPHRRVWIILAITGGIALFCCIACSVIASLLPTTPSAVPDINIAATSLAQQHGTVIFTSITVTPTLLPIKTPQVLQATPTPKLEQPTLTPTPKPCNAVNNNPWCYNFSPGNLIYNPPSNFCSYFNCIISFVEPDDPGDGFVIECQDDTYSQSGGESGACSHHGGELRPLYSH